MPKLQNMTIKQKLTAIIMLTSAVILLLAITVFVIWEQVDSRRNLVSDLYAHAGVIAENSKASLAFSDKEDAKQILSALQADSSIVFACIYDKQGQVFAEFQSADITEKIQAPKPREDDHSFELGYLCVFRNIVLDGEIIGAIYLRDDMSTVRSDLVRDIVVALIILTIALIMSYFLTSKLQKVVSGPILSLAEVAKNISEKRDYSTRALKQSDDEVGRLIDTFNEMLEQIQQRDSELEIRVKERTSELSSTNVKLAEEIAERSLAQKTLRRHIKQLNCLYGLSRLIEKQKISLEQIFQETPDLIRSAYQYPDDMCVRITFEGIQYKTDNFEKSQFGQYAPVNIHGNKAGEIEVYYLGEKPETGRGPFLEGERALLDAVAENLGKTAENKKAAETLRLFRNLIDRSDDSIFVMEPEWGRFLDVNDRACDSLGYTREELLNKGLKDVEESMLDDSTWKEHVKKLKHKSDLVIEGEHRRKDGTTFYVETSLRLVNREDKDYVIAVARDITERKKAEDVLKESEIKFRTIFENAGGAFFLADIKTGRVLECNSKAEKLTGRTRSEILRMHQSQLHPKGEAEKYKEKFHNHVEQGHLVDYEGEVQHKDGRKIPVLISAETIKVAEKDVIVGLFVDITERKRMEKAIQESEERIRAILDSVQAGVVIVDEENRNIEYANPAAAKMAETTIENMVGNICHKFICPAEIDQCPIIDLGKKVDNAKKILLKSNGEEMNILKTVTRFDIGEHGSLIETFVDIDKLELAEQKQAQLLEQLEAINDELKDFAYIVSHDLKTPLRGIKTLADWLTADYADKLDENGREQIDLLSQRVERMHNLIDGVLQYSKVGRVKEEKGKVNLNELVSEVIDTVAPPENIEITVENQLPVIECEETRITQVFQNLLSNAIKYMDKPQGRIRIGCVEENGFWNFSVADNGPGIEEKHFERIFRIFQTLSPRDEFESTGVGLTVVKKIVELYEGEIWVESKLGQGCTFFFTLPSEKMGVKNAKLEANIISRR